MILFFLISLSIKSHRDNQRSLIQFLCKTRLLLPKLASQHPPFVARSSLLLHIIRVVPARSNHVRQKSLFWTGWTGFPYIFVFIFKPCPSVLVSVWIRRSYFVSREWWRVHREAYCVKKTALLVIFLLTCVRWHAKIRAGLSDDKRIRRSGQRDQW